MFKRFLDLGGPSLTQAIAAAFLRKGYDAHLQKIRAAYKLRRDAAMAALEQHMPKGVSWTRPEGGFQLWVTMPPAISSIQLFLQAVEAGVAIVPGPAHDVDGRFLNCFRLGYGYCSPEEIRTANRAAGPNHRSGWPRAARSRVRRRSRKHLEEINLKEVHMSEQNGTMRLKTGLAEMLKGGVIMDVVSAGQAAIAQDGGRGRGDGAGARARRYSQGRRRGAHGAGIEDPRNPAGGFDSRHGQGAHRAFRRGADAPGAGVDFIDESEVLTPADESFHINKHEFKVPFVCGARDLGEALRRIGEGAAMIRTKGEAGSGNIVEAVRHMRAVTSAIRRLGTLGDEELMAEAKQLGAPYELVAMVAKDGKAAGAELCRGRNRHSRGRRPDDAAWRAKRLRGLGHLQIERSGAARARNRDGGHALPRP